MEQIARSYAMRFGLTVYVDRYEDMEMSGRIFSPVGSRISYQGVLALLNSLNGICDVIGYPQSTHQLRSFVPEQQERKMETPEEAETMDEIMRREKEEPRGAAATFVVQIRFRQNATWQGSIKWMDSGKSRSFRSTLELINLMEGALESTQGATTKVRWEEEAGV